MNIKFTFTVLLALALVSSATAASGNIWTTEIDCGDEQQDVNHYMVGQTVFINGKNFDPGTYAWSITGQPGGASSDPNQVVKSGNVTVGPSGTFCFAAYVVQGDDRGEYSVQAGQKKDNYRVDAQTTTPQTCEEALAKGLIIGNITNSTATVKNNAKQSFEISLVSYQMYAALIDDQTYFSSTTKTVGAGKTVTITTTVPACGYQIDLVCGAPITNAAPWYGGRVISSNFVNQNSYCTQVKSSSSPNISTTLTIAPFFPQQNNYVFQCMANGFTATRYNWYYGDGAILYNSTLNNTYHAYAPGNFTVACTATDGANKATDVLSISVQ
jgi:hypothetical protein